MKAKKRKNSLSEKQKFLKCIFQENLLLCNLLSFGFLKLKLHNMLVLLGCPPTIYKYINVSHINLLRKCSFSVRNEEMVKEYLLFLVDKNANIFDFLLTLTAIA